MNPKYLYLTINALTVIIPLAASFYPSAPFYRKWKIVAISMLIPGLFFLMWDQIFTYLGIWGFNERYLTGINIGFLPVEEVLFFVCIPYACVFTYFSLTHLLKNDFLKKYQRSISTTLVFTLGLVGTIFIGKAYTATSFLFLAGFLAFEEYYRKAEYLSRFYLTYITILIPFFIVNGILTGTYIEEEVVWYNNQHNLEIRIGSIPVEDTIYGMLLMMMNVSLFERLNTKAVNQSVIGSTSFPF